MRGKKLTVGNLFLNLIYIYIYQYKEVFGSAVTVSCSDICNWDFIPFFSEPLILKLPLKSELQGRLIEIFLLEIGQPFEIMADSGRLWFG